MTKELQALEDLISFIGNGEIADTSELCEYVAKRKDLIETALKEKEKQDQIIKTIKEIISFKASEPEFEMDDDDSVRSIFGRVYLELKRAITNNERELFRNWVLETCFPKELKAFEIIKNKLFKIDLRVLIASPDYDAYCFCTCYTEGGLTQEEYNLLKGVLNNEAI